jgi:hypothetical protein
VLPTSIGSHFLNKVLLFAAMASMSLLGCSRGPEAEFALSVPWALTGGRVVLDSHTHTVFSDGALPPMQLAEKAVENGCTAIAITDHGDLSVRAATPEYFDEVDAIRAKFPKMIVFAGLEWNIPPYLGREHVTVLLEPSRERQILPEFKARFEEKSAAVDVALQWLAAQTGGPENVALIYNHPSRLDSDSDENYRDYTKWQAQQDLFIGFEGGPGHQKSEPPGDYRGAIRTRDRWDPVVAEIGGTWDRLLDQGRSVWGALAVSDYHSDRDFAPCEFARTYLRIPQKDHRGILQALRAGSFWAGHGRVLDDLAFIAVHPALGLPATVGETVRLNTSSFMFAFRVALKRGPAGADLPLTVEIIGNGVSGKPESVARGVVGARANTFDWTPTALVTGEDGRSAYFRARVTAQSPSGDVLVAYTNPIRILVRD